jgi:hypothetical protein
MKRSFSFWFLIITSVFLTIMYISGQTLAVFNYDLAIAIGMQESEAEVGQVGIAYAKGFGFGDTLIYIPLIIIGIIGLIKRRVWGVYAMFGAMAITVYWPVVHLYAITIGKGAINLSLEKMTTYYTVLSLIIIYGLWGMWYLYKNRHNLTS